MTNRKLHTRYENNSCAIAQFPCYCSLLLHRQQWYTYNEYFSFIVVEPVDFVPVFTALAGNFTSNILAPRCHQKLAARLAAHAENKCLDCKLRSLKRRAMYEMFKSALHLQPHPQTPATSEEGRSRSSAVCFEATATSSEPWLIRPALAFSLT